MTMESYNQNQQKTEGVVDISKDRHPWCIRPPNDRDHRKKTAPDKGSSIDVVGLGSMHRAGNADGQVKSR